MVNQLTWKIGGQQGEGIESAGQILAKALTHQGYFLYGIRSFSSRIKGGATNNRLRISTTPVGAISDYTDLMLAFDQEAIDLNVADVRDGGWIIADSGFNPSIPTDSKVKLFPLPISDIAKENGTILMRNMVCVGISCALLGLDPKEFFPMIEAQYGKKGEKIVTANQKALMDGFEKMTELGGEGLKEFCLEKADGKPRMLLNGNDSFGFGAITGGCRFYSGYPITPSTEIMQFMMKRLPEVGGAAVQTEDELSACIMAIGANYTGARSFTATCGPGVALMGEALGLAVMAEIPMVVVNVQRGGPSTGLASKHEQSDLYISCFGSHGDAAKIVIASTSIEDLFYDAAEAMNLAEEFQTPVMVLSDQQMGLGEQTVEPFDLDKVEIRRGNIVKQADLPELQNPEYFKRYLQDAAGGISPRVFPGMKNGIHGTTGLEHDETGKPFENPAFRTKNMDKRLNKLNNVVNVFKNPLVVNAPHAEAEVLIMGMGGIRGVVEETAAKLNAEGIKTNTALIRLVNPMPKELLNAEIAKAKRIVVVEHNQQAQFAGLMKMYGVDRAAEVESVLQYDGGVMKPSKAYRQIKEGK
jgi:2-oxoacid:acceptor oxidoreductase, alpha subunit